MGLQNSTEEVNPYPTLCLAIGRIFTVNQITYLPYSCKFVKSINVYPSPSGPQAVRDSLSCAVPSGATK